MVVIVYVWRFRKKEAIGHVSMRLGDGTYISWWPVNGAKGVVIHTLLKKGKLATGAKAVRTLQDDIDLEQEMPNVYELSGIDEEAIRRWWELFQKENDKWHLKNLNCSTVVYRALCAGTPRGSKVIDGPTIWTPWGIESFINSLVTHELLEWVRKPKGQVLDQALDSFLLLKLELAYTRGAEANLALGPDYMYITNVGTFKYRKKKLLKLDEFVITELLRMVNLDKLKLDEFFLVELKLEEPNLKLEGRKLSRRKLEELMFEKLVQHKSLRGKRILVKLHLKKQERKLKELKLELKQLEHMISTWEPLDQEFVEKEQLERELKKLLKHEIEFAGGAGAGGFVAGLFRGIWSHCSEWYWSRNSLTREDYKVSARKLRERERERERLEHLKLTCCQELQLTRDIYLKSTLLNKEELTLQTEIDQLHKLEKELERERNRKLNLLKERWVRREQNWKRQDRKQCLRLEQKRWDQNHRKRLGRKRRERRERRDRRRQDWKRPGRRQRDRKQRKRLERKQLERRERDRKRREPRERYRKRRVHRQRDRKRQERNRRDLNRRKRLERKLQERREQDRKRQYRKRRERHDRDLKRRDRYLKRRKRDLKRRERRKRDLKRRERRERDRKRREMRERERKRRERQERRKRHMKRRERRERDRKRRERLERDRKWRDRRERDRKRRERKLLELE